MSGFDLSGLHKYIRWGAYSSIVVSTNPSPVTISGDTYYSLAIYDDNNNEITYQCDYTSSDDLVATFETPNNGTITFLTAGTVVITITHTETGASTTITIVVV